MHPALPLQIAFLVMGIGFGGPSTKLGGCCLLVSLFAFGVYVGWALHGKRRGGD